MQIALIQHHHNEHGGYLLEWAAKHNITLHTWRSAVSPEFAPASSFDGVIVLGGEADVEERETLPWMQAELQWLQLALADKIPCVGICLGSQMLAHLLGEDVQRLTIPEYGVVPLICDQQAQPQLPARVMVLQAHNYHFTVPDGAKLVASSELCPQQIFIDDKRRAMGLQCHLEWSAMMYQELIGPLQQAYDPSGAQQLLQLLLNRHFHID